MKNLAATYSPVLLCTVPSATRGLTSEFEMGSGVSPSLLPPEKNRLITGILYSFESALVVRNVFLLASPKSLLETPTVKKRC